MMKPQSTILPCGKRLHLQHGPIDLIIGVDKNKHIAFAAAEDRFQTILEELVEELPFLRARLNQNTSLPKGDVARKMHAAASPFCNRHFVTRMAAVAGAVADIIMEAMRAETSFSKAYVNNGGDISLYLGEREEFITAMSDYRGADLGRISIEASDDIGGIATSGRHGRSLSFGIADSVTVLADTAAEADVAATLITNAVDLAGHRSITRTPANMLDPDSDLGEQLVVTDCKQLSSQNQIEAITNGQARAQRFLDQGLIKGAAIFLQDEVRIIGSNNLTLNERKLQYA